MAFARKNYICYNAKNKFKGGKIMKITKIIGAIVGVCVLALTVVLAWIGFGTCIVISDHKSDDLAVEIVHRMKHPFE